jgi:hypothetical protein
MVIINIQLSGSGAWKAMEADKGVKRVLCSDIPARDQFVQ